MTGGFEAGQRFGDFEIIEVAGEGGMGIVYRARQLTLERVVALKVISPQVAGAPDFTTRFRRESRLAASIDHPHVVSVHSAGELEGRAYIAMQWVDGVGLDRLVADGPLDPARTQRIVSQLAGALDAAHAKELIHRDVKPANVLVRSIAGSDHAYLTDFGIARRVDVGASGLTKTGQTVGTVGYMAPEQISGDTFDGRADLYSLACVLYQCLTGRRPFEHDSEVAVMFAHVNDDRPRPSAVRPELARFDEVVVRALALEPEQRFQTGAELAESLAAAMGGGRPPAAPTVAGATVAGAGAQMGETRTGVTQPLPPEPPPPPRGPTEPRAEPPASASNTGKRVLIGLAALVVIAAIALGAYYAAGGFDSASTTVVSGTADDGGDTDAGGDDGGGGDGGGGTGGGGGGGGAGADRKAVVRVLDEYASDYSAQDGAGLGALLTADVTRFGASDAGCEQSGIAEVVAAYESQFALGTGTYSFSGLSGDSVDVSGDTASVTTNYSISSGGSGQISFELQREGEDWLISDIRAPCTE